MKILIFSPAWIGDMVMTQTLFAELHKRHQNLTLDAVSPPWPYDLLARMPEVSRGYKIKLRRGRLDWGLRKKMGCELRANQYDQVITMPISWKSALLGYWARAPIRTGYRGEFRYGLLNDIREKSADKSLCMVQTYVALAMDKHADSVPLNDIIPPHLIVDEDNQRQWLKKIGIDPLMPLVMLMPGAEYGPAKRWPEEKYAQVAKKLMCKRVQVVILGSPRDKAISQKIVSSSDESLIDLCGKTKLVDTIDLLAACDLAISNDSGLMHIAAAVNVAQIAIFRTTSPEYTPPINKKAYLLSANLSGFSKKERIKLKSLDGISGFSDVSVDQVMTAIDQLRLREGLRI